MRIYLYELSEDSKHLHFTEKDDWVAATISQTQETALSAKPHYTVDYDLRRLQDVIFVKCKLDVNMGLLCSRCANGFDHHLTSEIKSMFTRKPQLTNQTANVGIAYSEPTGASGEDLEIEVLEKDYLELPDVLKEQVYLNIPLQPLCREDCKGICPVCGQDKNTQPCQCHRIKNPALANGLKGYRMS